jgi:hypothetical protein
MANGRRAIAWHSAALAALGTGVLLRLVGVDWGLPFIYDPDEPDFVGRAVRMLATGDLDPGWFGHPGTTTIYSFLLAIGGWVLASGQGLAAALDRYAVEPSPFFLVARLTVVAFAAGALALTWQLARRAAAARDEDAGSSAAMLAGLLALALLAVAPLHTQFSRNARPDIQMGFFVLASLLAAAAVARQGRWRDYLLAGGWLGLAVATKYPALLFAPVIALAHGFNQHDHGRRPWQQAERLAGAALATVAGLALGSPWLLASPAVVLQNLAFESRSYHLSGTSAGFWSSLTWYLAGTLRTELGWVGSALALAGGAVVLRPPGAGGSPHRAGQLVLAALVIFVPAMAALSLRWDRWMLPVVPLACVLAGVGAAGLWRLVTTRFEAAGRRLVAVALALLAVAAVAGPARESLPWTMASARGDSRNAAHAWVLENVPAGSRILVEAYAPQLPAARFRLYGVNRGRILPMPDGGRRYAVPLGIIGTLQDPAELDAWSIDYVVIANHYDRRLAEPARYAREIALYEAIMARGIPVFAADAAPWQAIGLPVRIYRLR